MTELKQLRRLVGLHTLLLHTEYPTYLKFLENGPDCVYRPAPP